MISDVSEMGRPVNVSRWNWCPLKIDRHPGGHARRSASSHWFVRGMGLLLVVMLAMSFRSLQADDGGDDYRLAVGLYNQQRWQKAADKFREFLKNYEKHEKASAARLYLGLSLVSLEKYDEARQELRRYVNENRQSDNLAQAKFRIGECSYILDDLKSAKTELEDFVKSFPDDPMGDYALPYLGDVLLRTKDPASALKIFDLAINKFPQGKLIDDARFGRARSLEALKNFDEAKAQYQELASRKDGPRAADALFHLAGSYFERKDFALAISTYAEFMKSNPQNPLVATAQLNTGYALFQSGRFEEAERLFEKIGKDPNQEVTAGYWRGRCLKSMGDHAKAAEVFKSVARGSDQHPLAEAILFEQALCERYLQHSVESRKFFEEVLKRFPTGEQADDSLHALIEMSIESGELSEAEQLLAQFQRDYPQSGLRLHVEMLRGRLDLARASAKLRENKPASEAAALYESASRRFESVMNESSIARTKRQSRYYLALTYQLRDQPAKALELIAPLVEQVTAEGAKSDLTDALVLQADCFYQQQDNEKALVAAAKYLELVPKGRQAARALSIQAMAAANLKQTATAETAFARLSKEFADHPLTSVTAQKLAEAAEQREDWAAAGQLYGTLAATQKDPNKRAYAVRGIAWSQYSQKQYLPAAETFARVIKEFPNHELVTECAYYRADSLMRADKTDQALEQFQRLFNSYPDNKPAKAGAEKEAPLEFYYKAGRWVANILTNAKRIPEADAAYEALLKRFPEPADLDKRLYDWALLNSGNDRYARSDEIWRRLQKETPDSPYANLAKLYLAESDLIANKLEEARKAFEQLIDSDKSNNEIKERSLYQLVVLALEQQRWPDVRKLGQRLITGFPKSNYLPYVSYGQAESYLVNPTLTDEERATVRTLLESIQQQVGNEKIRTSEWFDRVWVLLAELDYREQKYDDVMNVVEDLRKRDPNSKFLYQADEILGRSYKQQAPPKFDEARTAFKRVLSNRFGKGTETAAKSQFLIGDTYFLQGNWNEAFEAYQKVFSIYPFPEWQAEALLASGKCDEAQNEWKQAAETYRRLIRKFPKFSRLDAVKMRLEAAERAGG